jgi:dTDP-4-dehydrorhamnose 3,5-epimerase
MRVRETTLPGVLIVEPRVFRDARGFFVETWHEQRYAEAGIGAHFVQDNHSRSVKGTVRGLHWQERRPQGKLVRVIEGEIFDVAVDILPDSATFGHWVGLRMSATDFTQLYIPPGYAHGFSVTSEVAQVVYKCAEYYDPNDERGLIWNDPDIAIAWPDVGEPLLSERDRNHPTLRQLFGRGKNEPPARRPG